MVLLSGVSRPGQNTDLILRTNGVAGEGGDTALVVLVPGHVHVTRVPPRRPPTETLRHQQISIGSLSNCMKTHVRVRARARACV